MKKKIYINYTSIKRKKEAKLQVFVMNKCVQKYAYDYHQH